MYSGACPNFLTRAHARETEYKINSRYGTGTHARKKTFLSAL